MRLLSLRLSNFRQHVNTEIDFSPGLTGIIGPNGSGKSTILEAIAWALYGMPAARGTRESIRSFRAQPRASVKVELELELGAHRYRVSRGLTAAELYLDGSDAPIANSITGVNELVRQRIGMSLEEFFNTYFTGQKELSVMAAMGPSERAQFLSRVLGYDRLRTAQALVRDRRKGIVAEVAGLRTGMADPELVAKTHAEATAWLAAAEEKRRDAATRRKAARRELDLLTPQWEALQEERELLSQLTSELRFLEGEQGAIEREIARIDLDRAEIAAAREQLDGIRAALAPIEVLRGEIAQFERLARDDGRRRALLEADAALVDDVARLADRRSRIETAPQLEGESLLELDRRRAELQQVEEELEAGRTEWVRGRQEADTKTEQLKQQLRDLREQRERLVQLGENGICPTCARPLGDHYRTVLDLIDEQTETVIVDGRYYRARVEQLDAMPADLATLDERRRHLVEAVGKLERRHTKVQLAVVELGAVTRELAAKDERRAALRRELDQLAGGYVQERHEAARRDLERLLPLEGQAERIGALVNRAPKLDAERQALELRQSDIRKTLAVFAERRAALQFSDEAFSALRARVDAAGAELGASEMAGLSATGEVGNARAALANAQRAREHLERTQERLIALGGEKRLHDELDRAYSDLRTELNQQLRPEISDLASRFLAQLTDGRYTELESDESYNVTVLEDGVPKPVISGGEEDLANLVLRLAISQMIAERAGQPLSLLILDEIFGSLDEGRRHSVVDLLRRLQDRFEQVILITHIESVREGLDRIITVQYDEESGTSRIDQESSRVGLSLAEISEGGAT